MQIQHNQKNICIINTGGTIGMMPSDTGFVPAPGFLAEQLDTLSELTHVDMPNFHVIEFNPLIDSANATPELWTAIANTISQHYDDYDGFVILHGTDTMAYTASALSFILENLAKPILLTGAQVPIACIPSDARSNLIDALYVASHYDINEVCIYFNHNLYRGNRTRKKSAVNYSAFESPNYPVLGDVSADADIKQSLLLHKPSDGFFTTQLQAIDIAIIRLFPGLTVASLKHTLQYPSQALIIQSYGMGNAPEDPVFLDLLSTAVNNGMIIVNCTQCPHGGVSDQTYATGHALATAGVLSAMDMTIETTIAKLTYLFSLGISHHEIKTQFQMNLRGETSLSKN